MTVRKLGSRIAIVIPVFKHSALVQEALASALDQDSAAQQIEIVVVDDGCPTPQTFLTLVSLPNIHRNVHYVRQINAGLSAARNCGVRFVLERLPSCDAIYFLDADNRLSPQSLGVFGIALSSSDADWFYPDIHMFGMVWRGDYSGPFRRLTETFMNICEAGSLVRTRVFEAGVRFDETMRDGYEDWEFWLSAIRSGFRGQHLPRLGLQYRKRAESMLADSTRLHGAIVNYIERKHGWLHDSGTLTTIEHLDAPRYAIIDIDSQTVRLTSDPEHTSELLSLDAYRARLRASFAHPNWHSVGAFIVLSSGSAQEALRTRGLLRFALWDFELQLLKATFAGLSMRRTKQARLQTEVFRPTSSDPIHAVAMSMRTFRDVIGDALDAWISQVASMPPDILIYARRYGIPDLDLPSGTPKDALARLAAFCRGEWAAEYPLLWSGAADIARGTPDVTELPILARGKFGSTVTANRVGARVGRVAFLLPIFEFGGVEKVAYFVARSLKQAGYHVDLIIIGRSNLQLHERQADAFEQTFFVDHEDFNRFAGPDFLGTSLPSATYPNGCEYLTNLLSSYEIVIGCHAADALSSFSALRKRGVLTINYLHLLEYTDSDRIVGHPVLGLAYEHATDLFLTCSERLTQELGMLGVPGDKIVTVPNAGGMDLPDEALQRLLLERQSRASMREPLHVLYLGRLDLQKGIDRVAEIFEALKAEPERFVLSAVGSAVIDGGGNIPEVLTSLTRPAIQKEAELAKIYAWADVIILPSRYEGVPLTILEAQAHGVVPVATRVGAVDEIVTDCVTGFMVDEDAAVTDTIKILQRLETDRYFLLQISKEASRAGRSRSWNESTKLVIDSIEHIRKTRPQHYEKLPWLGSELRLKTFRPDS